MTIKTNWIVAAGLIFALAACTTEPEPPAETTSDEAVTEDAMITDHGPALDVNASIDAARENLAERLNVEDGEIQVVEAREVTWNNGAMGCPEDGGMYSQALVEGYYILLRVGDDTHAYHAGRDGRPFYCPSERSQTPPASPSLY